MKPIGGFFEACDPGPSTGASILESWVQDRAWTGFVNARSALAALAQRSEAKVWFPNYLCRDAAAGITAHRIRLYRLNSNFQADLDSLKPVTGDMVVAVSYFGRSVGDQLAAFAQDRQDVMWVEDRAQALGPADGIAAAWRLYSPRKLLGVADGGLLVTPLSDIPLQTEGEMDASSLWAPCRLRQADPEGLDNAAWHAVNQAKERAMPVSLAAMTPASKDVLEQTSLAPLAQARIRNWRCLHERLRSWSAFDRIDGPPLGYVLDLPPEAREPILKALHASRIFAAVHWRETLGADPHGWSQRLVTLPCDHRYGVAEMDRIADAVEAALS